MSLRPSRHVALTWKSKASPPSLKLVVPRSLPEQTQKDNLPLYTVMVIDKDHPFPYDPKLSPYVLYLRTNINYQGTRGDELLKYTRMKSADEIVHRLYAIAYTQPAYIRLADVQRANFDLDSFVKDHRLVHRHQCLKLTT